MLECVHRATNVSSKLSNLQAGANLVLLARREEALKATADQVIAAHKESGAPAGGNVATVTLDVSNREAVKNLWSKVPTDLRKIDILGALFLLYLVIPPHFFWQLTMQALSSVLTALAPSKKARLMPCLQRMSLG